MNKQIDKRLQAFEQRIFNDPDDNTEGIFFVTVNCRQGAPSPEPIIGWRYDGHEIIRLPDETDKDLQLRALEIVGPFLRTGEVPTFFAIQN